MEFSTSTSTYIISGLCNILPVVFKLYSGPDIIHDFLNDHRAVFQL